MRILIVEDEVRLAEALAQIMEEQGYTADLAYHCEASPWKNFCGKYAERGNHFSGCFLPGQTVIFRLQRIRKIVLLFTEFFATVVMSGHSSPTMKKERIFDYGKRI